MPGAVRASPAAPRRLGVAGAELLGVALVGKGPQGLAQAIHAAHAVEFIAPNLGEEGVGAGAATSLVV